MHSDGEMKQFEFNVLRNPIADSYSQIGVCERFGFGFMIRDSGYLTPLLGPEIYRVENKYELTDTTLIDIYSASGKLYYPESSHTNLLFVSQDILIEDRIYKYKGKVESNSNTDAEHILLESPKNTDKPQLFSKQEIKQKIDSDEAIMLWPLVKKFNR